MLISKRYKFVFLSNPKCGSSTFRSVLARPSDIAAESIIKSTEDAEQVDFMKKSGLMHWPAMVWKDSFDKALESDPEATMGWGDYYTFTTIRNPYKKLVSWYFFLQPDKNWNTMLGASYNPHDTSSLFHHHFNDFMEYIFTPEGYHLRLPTYEYFCTDWKTGEQIVDDIFKIEEINETFQDKFKEKTGLTVANPLPRLNPDYKSAAQSEFDNFKGNHYDLYNESSKQLAKDWYSTDIEKFNYQFGQ